MNGGLQAGEFRGGSDGEGVFQKCRLFGCVGSSAASFQRTCWIIERCFLAMNRVIELQLYLEERYRLAQVMVEMMEDLMKF